MAFLKNSVVKFGISEFTNPSGSHRVQRTQGREFYGLHFTAPRRTQSFGR